MNNHPKLFINQRKELYKCNNRKLIVALLSLRERKEKQTCLAYMTLVNK
jgi:hypothetical protein